MIIDKMTISMATDISLFLAHKKSRNIWRDFSGYLFYVILAFKVIEEFFHAIKKTRFFWAMFARAFTHFLF